MESNDPPRNLPLVTEPRGGKKRAATWQIALTTFGVIAIVAIFLWGINNQRDETAGQQTAATIPAAAAPQGGDIPQGQQRAGQQPPSTTGQGTGVHDGERNAQPQTDEQKAKGQPADSNDKPARQLK